MCCSRYFKCQTSLYAHYSGTHFKNEIQKLIGLTKTCQFCIKEFKSPSYLAIHVGSVHKYVELLLPHSPQVSSTVHNNDKTIKRRILESGSTCDSLNEIKKIFKCNVCEFQSYYKQNIKRHKEKIHEGIVSKSDKVVTYDTNYKEHFINTSKAQRK